jgi:hypothetical protein
MGIFGHFQCQQFALAWPLADRSETAAFTTNAVDRERLKLSPKRVAFKTKLLQLCFLASFVLNAVIFNGGPNAFVANVFRNSQQFSRAYF